MRNSQRIMADSFLANSAPFALLVDTRRSQFMATDMATCISQIGETAGQVWQILNSRGTLTIPKLVKEIDVPRDVIMQALGWLAREGKIDIEEDSRTKTVSLR
jgi:hypothetical protein